MLLEENFQICLSVKNSIKHEDSCEFEMCTNEKPTCKACKTIIFHVRNVLVIDIVFN